MDWDEAQSKQIKPITTGEDLRRHSVAELEGRILAFEAEINRIRAEIEAKKAHNRAASSIFKST